MSGAPSVLVLGATSGIAEAVARRFARDGSPLCLVARRAERLEAVARDLRLRGAGRVETLVADLADASGHARLLDDAEARIGVLDVVFLAHGVLPDQLACEEEPARAVEAIGTNFTSAASLLLHAALRLERSGRGTLAAVSSVAGDRGRRGNYVYGAAKAGLTAFLSGLRARLGPKGIRVVTIIPGPVDSAMTDHLPRGPSLASLEEAGAAIHAAILRGRPVVYVPRFWWPVMLAIRLLPERLFQLLAAREGVSRGAQAGGRG